MTASDPWADLPASGNGNYQRWTEPGQSLVGEVIAKNIGRDSNDAPVPQLVIRKDSGEEVTVTASQAQLRSKLLEAAPELGNRIAITYTGDERREGGKTLKCFDVATKGPNGAAPAAAPVGVSASDLL